MYCNNCGDWISDDSNSGVCHMCAKGPKYGWINLDGSYVPCNLYEESQNYTKPLSGYHAQGIGMVQIYNRRLEARIRPNTAQQETITLLMLLHSIDTDYIEELPERCYKPGEVIPLADYKYFTSFWVSPSGTMIYVDSCGHYQVARKMGFDDTDAMERVGYIHVSGGCLYYDKMSQDSLNTLFDWYQARGKDMPDNLMKQYNEAKNPPQSMSSYLYIGMRRKMIEQLRGYSLGD